MIQETRVANTVFYLIGPPGIGKMTVGRHLAEMTGARLVHNHLWLNPVFSLIEQDGRTPLPDAVWTLTAQVRHAVFETVRTLTPISWNLVFTHAAVGENEADREVADEILGIASGRHAQLLVIQMTCAADVLAARVAFPERRLLFKENDVDAARANASLKPFDPGHPNTIVLDTTHLSAETAAREILQMARDRSSIG